MCIDEDQVIAEVKWEDLRNTGINFPHIYGPLNIESVIKTVPFEPKKDGFFKLPKELA